MKNRTRVSGRIVGALAAFMLLLSSATAAAAQTPPTPSTPADRLVSSEAPVPTGAASSTDPVPLQGSATDPAEIRLPSGEVVRKPTDGGSSMGAAGRESAAGNGVQSGFGMPRSPAQEKAAVSTKPAGTDEMPGGVDVANWQGNVNWQNVWNQGARFAYVKASEGPWPMNEYFAQQYNGSASVGMIRGAYHFARPNLSSGGSQAQTFVKNGGGWSADGKTLPGVLDLESNNSDQSGACFGMSPAQLTSWTADFLSTYKSLTSRDAVIYTGYYFWRDCVGNTSAFSQSNPLWIPSYGIAMNKVLIPGSWPFFTFWQFSDKGPYNGGDSNVFNGDLNGLRRLATGAVVAGSLDDVSLTRSGAQVSIKVQGWAVDPSNPRATTRADTYITGPDNQQKVYSAAASTYRPDVNQALGYGDNHGFELAVPISSSGKYQVCTYAIGQFQNTLLKCVAITANGVEPPRGFFDAIGEQRTRDSVSLNLRGWSVDPANATSPTPADAYITYPDGSVKSYRMSAGVKRDDVAQATGYGANHGFDQSFVVNQAGTYTACLYAIGQYSNSPLGCKTITVQPNPAPMGFYDSLSLRTTQSGAELVLRGWTLDPTLPEKSIPVHVYVQQPNGSNPLSAFTANRARPDVNRAFGTVGDHGFEATIPITTKGTYTVCAYGIPVAPVPQGNTLLGCKTITVQ